MKRRQKKSDVQVDETPTKKSRRNEEEKVRTQQENQNANISSSQEEDLAVASTSQSFSAQNTSQFNYADAENTILRNLKSGKIKKISLKNFMCHRNFEVNMNENINVFVGDNGSGKSAILAALAIGLGSKASSTSRSTSLKELVRRGENSASIEIVLANDGVDAFESENYGKEITVVRNISASGSSSYKIKSETGRVVTTSRSDLMKMTLCLNIQVENPVLILNQDAARSFLKECDPKKLYQFFLKATQIEAIIEKLNACYQSASSCKTKHDNIVKNLKCLSTEIGEINEKYNRLRSVETIREEIENLKNELNWLHVSVVEKELLKCQKEITKKRVEFEELNHFIKNKKHFEDELKVQIADLGVNFVGHQRVLTEKAANYDIMKQDALQTQDKVSLIVRSMKKSIDKKSNIERDIRQLETDIQEREENPLNVDNQKKQNELKLQELRGKLGELKSMLDSARRDSQMLQDTIEQNKDKEHESQQRKAQIQNNARKLNEQIKQIDLSAKDVLSIYGRSMPNFVNRIQQLYQQKRFSQLPRGPIGKYIEIPNKKYRNAVENILGNTLHTFYVNSDKDRIELGKILKNEFPELSQKTTIITGQFSDKVYDVSRGMCRPPQNAQLLMNLVKVNDPVVMNCLIDQRAIETILIVDDTDLAMALTSEESNIPRNLQKVILLKPFSEFYPAPNYRTYTLPEKPARFLQGSMKEVKKQLENEKSQVEQKLSEISNHIAQIHEQVKSASNILKEKQGNAQKIQQKYDIINRQIEELQNIEYPPENENEYLKVELEQLKVQRDRIQQEISEEEAKKSEIDVELKRKESALKEFKKEMKSLENELQALQSNIDSTKEKMNEMTTDVKFKKNQLNTFKDDLAKLEKDQEKFQQNVDELIAVTEKERVRTDKSEEKLNQLIKKKQRLTTQIQSSNEDVNEVKMLLDGKNDHFAHMTVIGNTFGIAIKKLQEMRERRFQYVKRLKSHMSLKVKHKFNSVMTLRNYTAEVDINNNQKTLELKVIPRDAAIKGAVSNTKSLSGGERSFSTVAFLIALWSCVDHPFYFLDEYDVFSDDYNRHIMTMLLFDEAKKKKDKQYGFLTPQDLTNIEADEGLVIHKLQDPKRC